MLPGSKLLLGWRECFVTASPVKAVMGLLITFILFLLSHVFVEGEFLLPFKNKMYMSTFPVKETDLLPYGIQSLSDESCRSSLYFPSHQLSTGLFRAVWMLETLVKVSFHSVNLRRQGAALTPVLLTAVKLSVWSHKEFINVWRRFCSQPTH